MYEKVFSKKKMIEIPDPEAGKLMKEGVNKITSGTEHDIIKKQKQLL